MKAIPIGKRIVLVQKFKEWCKENNADEGLENFIAFLQMNGLLYPKKTVDFIEKGEKSEMENMDGSSCL